MRTARLVMMLLAAGTFTSPARADAVPFVWHGPDCGDSAAVLERRLLELVDANDRERLSGRVAVVRKADRYEVELSIDLDGRPLGTRRFEVQSCVKAAETAAVGASLAVYEGESEPPGLAQSGLSPDIWTRHPEPAPDFAAPAPPKPKQKPALLQPRLGLLGQVEIAALPRPAWGGAITLELGLGRRWSVALQGDLSGEQSKQLEGSQVVHLSGRGLAARACAAPMIDERYRLDGCAGARFGVMRGSGEGFDVNRSATISWVAPLAAVAFSVRGPRFLEWRWEMVGSVPLARRRFLVDGQEVGRPSRVVGALRLGAVVRF